MSADPQNRWMPMAALGTEVVLAPAVSAAIGWWVDQKYDWFPRMTVTGLVIGGILSVKILREIVRRLNSND